MLMEIKEKDIGEGKKLIEAFQELSEEGKIMVTAYMSALQDKEAADSTKKAG